MGRFSFHLSGAGFPDARDPPCGSPHLYTKFDRRRPGARYLAAGPAREGTA